MENQGPKDQIKPFQMNKVGDINFMGRIDSPNNLNYCQIKYFNYSAFGGSKMFLINHIFILKSNSVED